MSINELYLIPEDLAQDDPGREIPTVVATYANSPGANPGVKEVPFYELAEIHTFHKSGESRADRLWSETTGIVPNRSHRIQLWHLTAEQGQARKRTYAHAQFGALRTFEKGNTRARSSLARD